MNGDDSYVIATAHADEVRAFGCVPGKWYIFDELALEPVGPFDSQPEAAVELDEIKRSRRRLYEFPAKVTVAAESEPRARALAKEILDGVECGDASYFVGVELRDYHEVAP